MLRYIFEHQLLIVVVVVVVNDVAVLCFYNRFVWVELVGNVDTFAGRTLTSR